MQWSWFRRSFGLAVSRVWQMLRSLATSRRREKPPACLGVTWPAFHGNDWKNADQYLETLEREGFRLVCFAPVFTYCGRNALDAARAPSWEEQSRIIELALRRRFQVVYRPVLEAPQESLEHCQSLSIGRYFFDLDPLCEDYKLKLIFRALEMLAQARWRAAPHAAAPPIRLELGSELLTSMIYETEHWEALLLEVRAAIERCGLQKSILLSHHFSQHLLEPHEFVRQLDAKSRSALIRYLRNLDCVTFTSKSDLPRLPSSEEVASALEAQEKRLRSEIFGGELGLKAKWIPPIHLGEFGVSPALPQQIAIGHQGLVHYLSKPRGRAVESALLCVTGPYLDVFGWKDRESFHSIVAEKHREFLRGAAA